MLHEYADETKTMFHEQADKKKNVMKKQSRQHIFSRTCKQNKINNHKVDHIWTENHTTCGKEIGILRVAVTYYVIIKVDEWNRTQLDKDSTHPLLSEMSLLMTDWSQLYRERLQAVAPQDCSARNQTTHSRKKNYDYISFFPTSNQLAAQIHFHIFVMVTLQWQTAVCEQ